MLLQFWYVRNERSGAFLIRNTKVVQFEDNRDTETSQNDNRLPY